MAAEATRQMEKKGMDNFQRAVVLGDGGWGTTIAILLHRKGIEVFLWGIFPEYVEFLRKERENTKYLPGVEIPRDIPIVSDLAEAIRGRDVIITAVPSHHMREICRKAAPYIRDVGRDARWGA